MNSLAKMLDAVKKMLCVPTLRWSVAIVSVLAARLHASEADTAGLDFFEKRIRPVFIENCYKCHSAQSEKLKGGLRVDTRDDLRKGGDSGPAIVEGNPDKSLLIRAVRYLDEELQMPPKGKKLAPQQIADLEAWVKMGAPDPRVATTNAPRENQETLAKNHWAFQPIKLPPVPKVKTEGWAQSSIDNFILARLEAQRLQPSAPANRRTLLQRAAFGLTGLPATPQEVKEFESDTDGPAFAKVVDRLLDSEHYGERWGRYWLDIARYADTKGYVFEEERRFPYSYTYRDYVIGAFNEDLPFDRFIQEQIAADHLALGDDKRSLAALGFLTLGRRFLNNQPDIIDDRIDVVTRGTMGLTVACARCHDHKYDPIPTRDYYSLYGVFGSSSEPAEKPLLGNASRPTRYPDYVAEREKREAEFEKYRRGKEHEMLTRLRQNVGDYLLVVHDGQKRGDQGKKENLARERKLEPSVASRWKESLQKWQKESHPVFAPWFAFAALKEEEEFSGQAAELAKRFAANTDTNALLHPLVAQLFSETPPASLQELSARYSRLFADVDKKWQTSLQLARESKADAPSALPDNYEESLRQVLYADGSPAHLNGDELRRALDTQAQQKLRALRRQVDELDATHPGAPPRAMALVDNPSPHNPRVFIRGNANNPGAEVPRQFLQLLQGEKRQPFTNGSGRLELARAITSDDNPLTARVIANRVWMYHFGAPLVNTPSDFGLRSDPPSHPELLDYLAATLIREKWSLKKLHRLILLSSVYQQSSALNAEAMAVDSENRLLWRMNRQRVDFEAMRDRLLAVSGQLDATMGGRPVELTTEPFTTRRTIYGFVERQNLPGLFRTFDFASPDATSPGRFHTTVPQQALFLMNSPFVVQQARQFVKRPEISGATNPEERIEKLYQFAYQRSPSRDELEMSKAFLAAQELSGAALGEKVNWQYGYGSFDDGSGKAKAFTALPHFTGSSWQGSDKLPDGKLGWVLLNANGGHVGNDLEHAAVRRWVAPRDGIVDIQAELRHDSEQGDGVRGRIISSRQGRLGEWMVHKGKAPTPVQAVQVKRGDTVDFAADCRETVSFDSFEWAPVIRYRTEALNYAAGVKTEWDAQGDFAGPAKGTPLPMNAWEKYAQVLLVANELFFVD